MVPNVTRKDGIKLYCAYACVNANDVIINRQIGRHYFIYGNYAIFVGEKHPFAAVNQNNNSRLEKQGIARYSK